MTTAQAKQYFNKIMATYGGQIAARIERGDDPTEALKAAVEFDSAKCRELLENKTEWAQATRKRMSDEVYDRLRG